ncbi:proline-rich receptor-like protein kinase PERK5 [Numida meleagris]|uniref:proline-rich receptor-like protein kinase PERK5 n=1 Tax=Numida meleagris TaxID=8996 RepID=UPI000B3DE533|nr:proline-rich receptor-like protein kinase PERK5 [Numida meleagris]
MYSSSSGWLVFFSPVLSSSPDHLSLPPPLSAHQRSLPPICPFKTDAQRSGPSAQCPSERTVPADPGAIPDRGAAGSAPEGPTTATPGEPRDPRTAENSRTPERSRATHAEECGRAAVGVSRTDFPGAARCAGGSTRVDVGSPPPPSSQGGPSRGEGAEPPRSLSGGSRPPHPKRFVLS